MQDSEFVYSGDEYFEKLWDLIDNSKICCWIITYHMKKSFIADETLRRLTKAAERGVNVVLYVDWLNYYPDSDLVSKLKKAGGKVEYLNSMNLIFRTMFKLEIFTKSIFKRHHEKVILIDNTVIIGSANFDIEYGETKYGNNRFSDLNLIVKNKCIKTCQDIFMDVAKKYNFKLARPDIPEIKDEELRIVVSDPEFFRHDIQELLLQKINQSQKRVIMAQGYFFHIKKVHKALKRAAKRGVHIELITTKERDQPVYKDLLNSQLAKKFLGIGGRVYEMTDKIFHTKMYIIDDSIILGSFNNDKWSWSMNSEVVFSSSNKQLSNEAFQIIEKLKCHSQEVKPNLTKITKTIFSKFWKIFLKNSEHVMNGKKNYKYFVLKSYVDDSTNSIEERHALKMNSVAKRKINTSTLNIMTFY